MKLARISKPLRSVQVNIALAGDLKAELERYASYYQHVHGESVDSKDSVPDILHAFLEADREFQTWSRSSGNSSHCAGAVGTPANGTHKAQA